MVNFVTKFNNELQVFELWADDEFIGNFDGFYEVEQKIAEIEGME